MTNARKLLGQQFREALAADAREFGLDLTALREAMAKARRRKRQTPAEREEYTSEEEAALLLWADFQARAKVEPR